MMSVARPSLLPRLFLLMMVALPASAFLVLLRVATEGGVPFLGFVFWQCLAGAAMTGAALLARRQSVPLSVPHLRYYTVSALFGLVIPYVAMTLASPHLPVGVMSLAMAIEPALTYLVALVLLLERYRWIRFVGLLIGVAGLMLTVLPETSLPSRAMVPWVAVALVVPVGWALWANWMARDWPPETESMAISFAMMAGGAAILLVPVVWLDQLWWFDAERLHLWWLVPLFGALNVWLWLASFETIRIAGPVFYATWTFAATPMIIGAGIVVFGEQHSVWIWTAFALLLLSLCLVNVRNGQAPSTAHTFGS